MTRPWCATWCGLSLCRDLRRDGNYSMPVILLTALGEEDDRIAGLETGADDYLPSWQ